MAVAVVLALDLATTARLYGLINALPDALPRQPWRAQHIVLASYPDNVDVADLDAAMATVTSRWTRLPITLAALGVLFGKPAATVIALPVPSLDLIQRHATLHAALADLGSDPSYKPGVWLPHIVLAETILVADSVEVLSAVWPGPITGWAVSLDLVRTEPLELLSSRPLRD